MRRSARGRLDLVRRDVDLVRPGLPERGPGARVRAGQGLVRLGWAVALGLALGAGAGAPTARAQTAPTPPPQDPNAPCGSRGSIQSLEVLGLTSDMRLLCFLDTEAASPRVIGPITGLQGGEKLIGMDFRIANEMLYGLGSAGGVYIINPMTAAAALQNTLRSEDGAAITLAGGSFGMDFNPATDRLRIVSDSGQDLRVNVENGATRVDPPLNPAPGTGITAIAYTNNDTDLDTGSVLYDIDTRQNVLLIQSPPDSGGLAPVGSLLLDPERDASFDIFSLTEGETTLGVVGLASVIIAGRARLVDVDLTTGRMNPLGTFGAQNMVIAIAIPLAQTLPIPDDDPTLMPGTDPGAPAPSPTPGMTTPAAAPTPSASGN